MIIPRAVASNAIVICDGLKGACLLSDSLNRVMAFQVTFSTLLSLTLPPLCLPHRKLVRATLQANKWASDEAQFTVIAFVAKNVANAASETAKEQQQKGPDLHQRVDNYILIKDNESTKDDESKGHMNRLKKAAIRFLTKPVAEGGKELPCLVSCLTNPHAARCYCDE